MFLKHEYNVNFVTIFQEHGQYYQWCFKFISFVQNKTFPHRILLKNDSPLKHLSLSKMVYVFALDLSSVWIAEAVVFVKISQNSQESINAGVFFPNTNAGFQPVPLIEIWRRHKCLPENLAKFLRAIFYGTSMNYRFYNS